MASIMTYNSETGELVCYLPTCEEVLRRIVPLFVDAQAISDAIQYAYKTGSLIGRLDLQRKLERQMDELNRS